MGMRLVFTEVMGHQEMVREAFQHDQLMMFDGPLDEEELVREAKGADVLSVFIRTKVSETVIDRLPGLAMINTRSTGFDHIAAGHAMKKGIVVTHVPDYGPHVVAEHAFCLLLACARHIIAADLSVREAKRFDFEPFMGLELKDKVLGVVGTGRIGTEVIRIAQGFGMKVVAFDIVRNEALASRMMFPYLSLQEVLERSDFVTIHVPLTPDTKNLIDRAALARMKQGCILINTARGGVVDQAALREALDSGHLYAAGLDVIADESDPSGDPVVGSDHAIVTPHIAFYTRESLSRMFNEAIGTIRSFESGKRVNEVPREYVEKVKAHTMPQD
jgi:phosphoglycerate dehydrogenase-like enzyme